MGVGQGRAERGGGPLICVALPARRHLCHSKGRGAPGGKVVAMLHSGALGGRTYIASRTARMPRDQIRARVARAASGARAAPKEGQGQGGRVVLTDMRSRCTVSEEHCWEDQAGARCQGQEYPPA